MVESINLNTYTTTTSATEVTSVEPKKKKVSEAKKVRENENDNVSAKLEDDNKLDKSLEYYESMVKVAESKIKLAESQMETARLEIEQLKLKLQKIENEITELNDKISNAAEDEDTSDLNFKLQQCLSNKTSTSALLDIATQSYQAAETLKTAHETEYTTAVSRVERKKELIRQEEIQRQKEEAAAAAKANKTGSSQKGGSKGRNNEQISVTKADYAKYGSKIYRFKNLTPKMQQEVIGLIKFAESKGLKISFSSTFRTNEEQRRIYATARPGYAAKPGNSRHEFGTAVDVKIEGANMSNKNDPKCKLLGQYWTSRGYTWGGNWTGANEPWHFDLRA